MHCNIPCNKDIIKKKVYCLNSDFPFRQGAGRVYEEEVIERRHCSIYEEQVMYTTKYMHKEF
jgi:hypothetical protein